MPWNRRRLIATLSAVAVGGAGFLPAVADPVHATPAPSAGRVATPAPGCRPATPAIAYRPSHLQPLAPQPEGRPVPCLVATGFSGAETQVAVLPDGGVVYEPAILTPGLLGTAYLPGAPGPHFSTQLSPGGLALSTNAGGSWRFVRPAGGTWVPQDDSLYVDRTTGRLYFYALSPDPIPDSGQTPVLNQVPAGFAFLMSSGDDGRTWTESALPGFVESENPRFTTAPAPAGQPRATAGPDVAYWCANNIVKVGLPLPSQRDCYRSLDAGRSWRFASVLASYPLPQHRQCGQQGENFNDGDPNYPEGAPDGSLYVEVNCGANTFLARSTDEGATWPLIATAAGVPARLPADGELRVASDGELVLTYQAAAGQIVLAHSSDGGRTWSAPEQLSPGGIGTITQWAFAERGTGTISLSLLVKQGTGSRYDADLVYSQDAAAADPLLWFAVLNPGSAPVRTSDPAPARDDFIGTDIGPNGTPWASFPASCPGPIDVPAACAGQTADPEANEGVAGRLELAAGP